MSTLSIGAQGTEVKILQRGLASLGYTVVADGSFGSGTRSAVVQFQTDHGLSPDGVVGDGTWAILDNMAPQGMDISHLNGPISWDNLSPHLQFAYCKASQGGGFRDPMFQQYTTTIKQKGLMLGAYHFLTFQTSAQDQANNFLSCGFDFSAPGSLPPAVDIEDQDPESLNSYISQNQAACIQLISDWINIVSTATGRTPVIYTYKSFWHDYLGNTSQFGAQPLWVAAYQPAAPGVPSGWAKSTFWQYYGAGDDVANDYDLSIFNGNSSELKQFASPQNMEASNTDFLYQSNLNQKGSERDTFTLKRYMQFVRFIKNGDKILDVGCNTGRGGAVIKSQFSSTSIIGVDLISERIARIPTGIYDRTFDVALQQMEGYDNYFDVIVAGEVIEHILPSDFESFLLQCERMLKPTGVILFTTPNPNSYLVKLGRNKVFNDPSHVNILGVKQLKSILKKCGLAATGIKGSGKATNYIGDAFPLGFYGSYLSVISKKSA